MRTRRTSRVHSRPARVYGVSRFGVIAFFIGRVSMLVALSHTTNVYFFGVGQTTGTYSVCMGYTLRMGQRDSLDD